MAFFYCTGSAQELQSSVEVRVNGKKIAKIIPGEVCKSILKSGRNSIECARIGFGEKRIDIDSNNDALIFFQIKLTNGRWELTQKEQFEVPESLAIYADGCIEEVKQKSLVKEEGSFRKAVITGTPPPNKSKVIIALQAPSHTTAEAQNLRAYIEAYLLNDCVLIERENLDAILEEQRLSMSALFDNEKPIAGLLQAAEFVCFIDLDSSNNDSEFQLSVKIVDISTGQRVYQFSCFGSHNDLVQTIMGT